MTSTGLKDYTQYKLSRPFGEAAERDGLPSYFSTAYAVANGGKPVTRKAMNELGYYATIGSFLDLAGYPCLWNAGETDETVSSKIPGGYPKGAIVTLYDNGHLYEFLNTEDDNTKKPVTDDDGTITEETEAQNGWQPVSRMKEYSFFPDYSKRTLVNEFVVTGRLDRTITIPTPGWILIERTVANWDDLSVPDLLGFSSAVVYYLANEDFTGDSSNQDYIRLNEGPTATRFLPCNGTVNIRAEVTSPVTSITIRIYLYEMEA